MAPITSLVSYLSIRRNLELGTDCGHTQLRLSRASNPQARPHHRPRAARCPAAPEAGGLSATKAQTQAQACLES
eukprot:548488-Rhodomonas_salina.1